jgi:porphobilinogen deaminase
MVFGQSSIKKMEIKELACKWIQNHALAVCQGQGFFNVIFRAVDQRFEVSGKNKNRSL